jgi:hypothetical protein
MRWFMEWLKRHVQDVPAETSCCEFRCRKPQCYQGEWEHCERRLFWASAGQSTEELRA